MATPTLTVYAYGNVDALHGIFNGIAMVMGAADFRDMIRVAVVIGFMVVAVQALLPNGHARGWTWFINVALISGILLVPKATVSIVDKLGVQSPVVVSNVPWALALVASVKSSIGSTLTAMFETSFQSIPGSSSITLPSELSYEQHGVMFGNRLIRSSREGDFSSLFYQGDTLNYLRNCIFPDLGRETVPGSFERSTSLITSISTPNPALFSTYHDPNAANSVITAPCPEVYSKAVAPGATNSAHNSLVSMAALLVPGVPTSTSEPQIEDSLVAMYGKSALASSASSAQDIMIQNILINAVADASALYGAQLDDPSVLMFASMRSQAVGQMNASYLVQGRIAEEALPIIRNITESVLFAIFPVFCILAMATEGQTLARLIKSYFYTMVWVELWPPMFAIVSYLATIAATRNLAGAGQIAGSTTGLSLQTATGIYSTAISDVSVASWMVTFVPIIAAALLYGADKIMSVANASGAPSASDQTASNASKGNLSMGNVSFEQQELAEYRSDARVRRTSSIGGTTSTNLLTGASVDQYAQSSGPVSLKDTAGWGQRLSEGAQAATQSGESHQRSYETALDAAYNRAISLVRSGGASARLGSGFDIGKDSAESLGRAESEQAASQIGKQFGITDSSDIRTAIEAGVGSPIVIKAMASKSSAEQESLRTAISDARNAAHTKSVERKQSFVDTFRSSDKFDSVRSSDRQASNSIDSTMREAEGFRERAASDFSTSERYQQAQEKYAAFARLGEASWNNEFYRFARTQGVDPMHGNVPTSVLRGMLQEFVLSGELFKSDAGETFWVPQQGQGPNIMQGTLDGISPSSLRGGFDASSPGAGRRGVSDFHDISDAKVLSGQRAAGLSPLQAVNGRDLQGRVDGQHDATQRDIGAAGGQIRTEQGELQRVSDQRSKSISGGHDPVYRNNPITNERNGNRAQDEAWHHDRPFATEGAAVEEREQAARADEAKHAPPEIPTK